MVDPGLCLDPALVDQHLRQRARGARGDLELINVFPCPRGLGFLKNILRQSLRGHGNLRSSSTQNTLARFQEDFPKYAGEDRPARRNKRKRT